MGSTTVTRRGAERSRSHSTDPDLLAAIVDVVDALIVVLDAEGRIVLFNRACEALTGYTAEEIAGRRVWDELLAPEETASVQAVFRRIVRGDYPNRHINHWRCKDGSRRLIRWSNTAIPGADGGVAWIIGTGIDISDARRTDETLREERRRAQAVLDTAVDGIIVIDETGRIETFNQAAERIFGYSAEEAIGCNVRMLMPPTYREHHDDYIRRYLETGERRIIGIGREVTGQRKDGSTFPMELAVGEVHLPGGRCFTGIVRDVTRRKEAEEAARRRLDELAHASRLTAMGEMASGVTHELNQPLAAIRSFAEACQRMHRAGTGSPELIDNALAQIAEQAGRAGEIVRRFRQFVRKEEVRHEPVCVAESVRKVLDLLNHEIRVRGIPVDLRLDATLPPVEADRLQIEQVLLNLVKNAIDAMDDGAPGEPALRITAERGAGGAVEVAVSDSGAGLPDGDPERLFETFFSTKPAGMGMGLSVSRSIVRAHGGELWAMPNPDGGATFRFTLPIDAADA